MLKKLLGFLQEHDGGALPLEELPFQRSKDFLLSKVPSKLQMVRSAKDNSLQRRKPSAPITPVNVPEHHHSTDLVCLASAQERTTTHQLGDEKRRNDPPFHCSGKKDTSKAYGNPNLGEYQPMGEHN